MADKSRTKEQLIGELARLRQRLAELEAVEARRKLADGDEAILSHDLMTSLKELRCFYNVGAVAAESSSLDNFLDRVISLVPLALQYPELARAEIMLRDSKYHSEDFAESQYRISSDIKVAGVVVGNLVVYYTEEMQFLEEEVDLIRGIAERIGDVVGRVEAEEALQKSEEIYRGIIESASDVIWTLSPEAKITSLSQVFETIMGWSCGEWIGKPIVSILHPDDLPLAMENFQRVLSGERVSPFELRVLSKSGVYLLAEVTGAPLIIGVKVVGILGIARDITERKKVEEELRSSEERLRILFEYAPDAYYISDMKGNFIDGNKAAEEIIGYRRGVLIGKSFLKLKLLPPREIPKAAALLARSVLGQSTGPDEMTLTRKDGSEVCLEIRTYPVKMQDKRVVLGIARDITERKLAEEALRDSQEFSSSLLDSSPNPILVINPDTSIKYVNPAMEKLTGFTSAELIGVEAPHPWWTEETRPNIQGDFKEVMHREAYRVEDVFQKKNGERFWVEITSKVIKREGKLEYHLSNWVDITDRKKLEERYRALFEQGLDGVFVIDESMRILMANQSAVNISGFDSVKELLEMNLFDFIHPEGRERTLRIISEDMFKNNLRQVNEFRCMKKTGEEIWISAVGALIEYEGKMVGLVSFRDITERKRAEQALRDSEEKFRTFMETASDLMHITDKDQNITYVNESMARTLGYSRKEMIGMHITQFLSEHSLEGIKQRAEKLIRQGKVTHEPVWITKEGKKVYLEMKVVAVYDDDGNYAGSRGISRDITERKKMGEELELGAMLLDNVQDAVNLSDFDGNILYVNETACKSLGYSREELLNVNLAEMDTAEYAHTLKWRNQELTKKKHTIFETTDIRKDGSMLPVEVHARLIEVGGKKLVLSVECDITERKQMEVERKELEQKAQQESRLASIGEMASGVAHEVNNPLVGVVGFSQLLMERKDLPDDVRGQLKMIHDGGQRVASIVKRLLSFTRQRKPERTYVDINQIIEATLEMVAYEMGTAGIKVVTQFAPELPGTMADAGQFQQVFLNIIINAEKEMVLAHGKGNFHIKTETIGNKIRISFRDDGPGIAKENLDRIFDPFFTTREVGQGTGLGLSVCHGIIAEHNGRIYVRSEPGKGATFIVELPVISEDRQV